MYFNFKLNCKQQQPAAGCVLTLLLRERFEQKSASKKKNDTNLKQNKIKFKRGKKR